VQGRGFAALRAHGIQVDVGLERAAALRLNQPFVTTVREGRPFVILKAATSLDGKLAAAPGTRTPLTSETALRHAHAVRARVDAVAVGSETLLVDDPLLTAREVYRERPLVRVVFDRRLRTPATARLFSTLSAGPVIILTSFDAVEADRARAAALERAGATVVAADTSLASALRQLPRFDVHSLVLEGGAALHLAAWDDRLVDYVQLYVAPVWLGEAGVPLLEGRAFASAALLERNVDLLGPDVLIEGYVHRPD
jgi:diaminohydroxyphosphoribosylaminopyrimidine deaminase/5-amino-6-(5-phosphoribosylamino)uracil reductase